MALEGRLFRLSHLNPFGGLAQMMRDVDRQDKEDLEASSVKHLYRLDRNTAYELSIASCHLAYLLVPTISGLACLS